MTTILATLIILLALAWLVSEFHHATPRWLRLLLGVATMLGTGWVGIFVASILPRYESDFHEEGMMKLETALAEERYEEVQAAVARYNQVAADMGTYPAAMGMWTTDEAVQSDEAEANQN